jgi:peptide deformylase
LKPQHQSQYSPETALKCEAALVTLLGNIGPWANRLVIVGGLAPRYIVRELPAGAIPHIGTTDVDVVVQLALDRTEETYATLKANLLRSDFKPTRLSYQWMHESGGAKVLLEFICDTPEVEPGRIFNPKGEGLGSGFGAFNVRGANLAHSDYFMHELTADRLGGGGRSTVKFRVCGILPFVVLKIFAFQERHERKDAYDLVYCLMNYTGGPQGAARDAARSPVLNDKTVGAALSLLAERFGAPDLDGPAEYTAFVSDPSDEDGVARQRLDAVAAVEEFLAALRRVDPPGQGTPAGTTEPPRLRVTKGTPWRIDAGRRAKWSTREFVAANAVDVRQIGDPVLHATSKKPRLSRPELEALVARMFASMVMAHGIGIAAPQIGVPLRVAIMDVDEAGIVALEPTIEWTSEEMEETSEGCLSVRGMYGMLERPVAARLVANDIAGKRFTLVGDEFGAQCMLHETDHLNGTLYVDRLKSREDLHTVEPEEEERVSA